MADNVTPLFRAAHPASPVLRVAASTLSPAERVKRSHDLVRDAAQELATGDPGSGVKALVFASATHLALTLGADEARAFFQMIAGVAGQVRPLDEPEPAA